ncbi:lactonase family protein [Paenibacillus sp. BC26]|uniref:lactonase family protein n=1 Tax=Paenibacillus sp. BC26 TaxID=1881032 RepID=UPI0008EFEAE1|nr:lactonase family protein [Paenibacillus sp. BC26]SFT28564.1 6-phosphogluconolactonase [Paenibacillus sp. BC26]
MGQQLFFVGSYSAKEQEGISGMVLHTEDGAISRLSGQAGIYNPSFLRSNEAGTRLYVVSETGAEPGSIHSFAIHADNGELKAINEVTTQGGSPCHVEFDATGKLLVVTNYTGGNLAVYGIESEDGALVQADFAVHEGSGPRKDRQEAPHPHSSIIDPANRYVLIADLGIDQIVHYEIDHTAQKLIRRNETAMPAGAGPRHMAFHPQSPVLYVINELDSTVGVYNYEAEQSQLTVKQIISTLPEEYDGATTCADIHVTADGRFLYASNRGHDSIAVYRIVADEKLELVEITPSGGRTPRNFAISPDGQYLLAANQDSDNIVTFRIDEATGGLTPTGNVIETSKPVCISFA